MSWDQEVVREKGRSRHEGRKCLSIDKNGAMEWYSST